MTNLTIEFIKMKLSENRRTVLIEGICFDEKVEIEMSILEIAKIFESDAKEISDLEGFGSEEYEDRCLETQELIKKFPDIPKKENEIEFKDVTIGNVLDENYKASNHKIMIYGEDLSGWNNEGIRIKFPTEIYDKYLSNKKFKIYSGEISIKLEPLKND